MKLRTGDEVVVLSGKDKGKTGKISRVFPSKNRVIVDGINIVKKHQKSTGVGDQANNGGIISREMSIHVSNVALLVDGRPSRISYTFEEGAEKENKSSKVRVAKRTGNKA